MPSFTSAMSPFGSVENEKRESKKKLKVYFRVRLDISQFQIPSQKPVTWPHNLAARGWTV